MLIGFLLDYTNALKAETMINTGILNKIMYII